MTDFDHELIAALAEGTLPADEAADLEARIGADPAASAELEAQRVALAAIAAAPAPQLDDLERMRLHRSVAAELDLVLPQPAASPRRRRWSVNWSALATAAAVLLGVALAAPLLSLLNTSDDAGDSTTTVAAAADAGDADVQSQALDEPLATVSAAADLESAAPAEDERELVGAPPETAMPDTTMPTAGTDLGTAFGPLVDFGTLDSELTQVRARFAQQFRLADGAADDGAEPPPCTTELRSSLADAGTLPVEESTQVLLLGTGTVADLPVYVLAVAVDGDLRQLAAVDAGTCATVATATVE